MTNPEQESPLPGVSQEEYMQLLLSVGHTSKGRRPLSPVEVGEILVKSKKLGINTSAMTSHLNMTDTSMPVKFIKLTELDDSIQYLVSWGTSERDALGFSVATQLSRVAISDQAIFVEMCLKNRITKDEARSVVQLFERSGQTLEECFNRVVARRPATRILEVIIGSITSSYLTKILGSMSQMERDELFNRAVSHAFPKVLKYSAKLGKNRFTIIGGKSVGQHISSDEFFSEKLNDSLKFCMEDNNN